MSQISVRGLRKFVTVEWLLVALIVVIGLASRRSLFPNINGDFSGFYLPWFEHLDREGFSGLGDEFADYNVPYLYLLWIGTHLPFEPLTWVKLISLAFEALSSIVIARIVFVVRRDLALAAFAGVTAFVLPSVVLNGSMWGQSDSIYLAFLLCMILSVLEERPVIAWLFFGLSLAFKLQAVFLLPWIGLVLVVKRHRWWTPAVAVLTVLVCSLPALAAGRSMGSLLSVYSSQAESYRSLVLSAATIYQWVPDTHYDEVRPAGILFAMAVAALFGLAILRRWRFGSDALDLLAAAAGFALLVPLTLPQMHDRYFYVAEVLVLLVAVLDRRFIVLALALQFTAVQAYAEFLFGVHPAVPYSILALIQLSVTLVVCAIAAGMLGDPATRAATRVPVANYSGRGHLLESRQSEPAKPPDGDGVSDPSAASGPVEPTPPHA